MHTSIRALGDPWALAFARAIISRTKAELDFPHSRSLIQEANHAMTEGTTTCKDSPTIRKGHDATRSLGDRTDVAPTFAE